MECLALDVGIPSAPLLLAGPAVAIVIPGHAPGYSVTGRETSEEATSYWGTE